MKLSQESNKSRCRRNITSNLNQGKRIRIQRSINELYPLELANLEKQRNKIKFIDKKNILLFERICFSVYNFRTFHSIFKNQFEELDLKLVLRLIFKAF